MRQNRNYRYLATGSDFFTSNLMGSLNVKVVKTRSELNQFTSNLLRDVHLLERMIEENWFDTDQMHIGAEQEFCLIDKHFKPATRAMDVLKKLDKSFFTTELAKFNVEANLSPQAFKGSCFTDLESELRALISQLSSACSDLDIEYVLTGILPTLRKHDLSFENLTPLDRYKSLAEAIYEMRGRDFELHLKGDDELDLSFDSVMLEACNTSFQVHLQVTPEDFATKYNIAQLVTAPVISASANSPLLFGKRLWHESRIGLFQQSIDTRITHEHFRDKSPRVMFGKRWIKDSVCELYKEDISRFRVMLMNTEVEDCEAIFNEGKTPKLRSLNIHNSTVYRWNRPCYGISPNGKPHLRIENRVLPSGPTVIDEVANAAFWLGLMNGYSLQYPDPSELLEFQEVKSNFHTSAVNGLNAKIRWVDGEKHNVSELILNELLPMAKSGLQASEVDSHDIDRLLNVIERRVEKNQNGSNWIRRSHANLSKDGTKEEVLLSIVSSAVKNQRRHLPVHEWPLADLDHVRELNPSTILVEEFMNTDLFTIRPEDILELVADMMDWQNVRYTPVENQKGQLVGLVSSRKILRHFRSAKSDKSNVRVKDIMIKDPLTVSPEETVYEAMMTMKKNNVGCLPVVKNNQLIGIVTEREFLNLTSTILKIINRTGKVNE